MLLCSDVTAFCSILVKGHILNKDLLPPTLVCTVAMGTIHFTSLVDPLCFVNGIPTLSAGLEAAVFQPGLKCALSSAGLHKHEEKN